LTTTGTPGNFHEPAAFNAMLSTPGSTSAMVMHAGDTVKIHWFTTAAQDAYHVQRRLVGGHLADPDQVGDVR